MELREEIDFRRTSADTKSLINKDVDQYLKDVKFYLRDINEGMVNAWQNVFSKDGLADAIDNEDHRELILQNFIISKGEIFKNNEELIVADAIVSPANSFGFMDGGIDWIISERFGWQLMERLQEVLKGEDYFGELLIGQAIIIEANDPKGTINYLISAPTMRTPTIVKQTPNAYLAFKAILMEVRKHNKLVLEGKKTGTPIKTVLCCGLGTAVGMMPFKTCATQMLQAYRTVALGRVFPHRDLPSFSSENNQLIKNL